MFSTKLVFLARRFVLLAIWVNVLVKFWLINTKALFWYFHVEKKTQAADVERCLNFARLSHESPLPLTSISTNHRRPLTADLLLSQLVFCQHYQRAQLCCFVSDFSTQKTLFPFIKYEKYTTQEIHLQCYIIANGVFTVVQRGETLKGEFLRSLCLLTIGTILSG